MDEIFCIICSADCSGGHAVHCDMCQMCVCPGFSPSTGVKCIRFAEAICEQLSNMPDDEKLHMFLSNYEKLDALAKRALYVTIEQAHKHGGYAASHPNDNTNVRMCISAINVSVDNPGLLNQMFAPLLLENLCI